MPSKLLPTEPKYSTGTTDQGEYLSVGERKALFRKRRISGADFKKGSSVNGALAPTGRPINLEADIPLLVLSG